MGWTSYHAQNYTRKGTVDRKAELDILFTQEKHDGKDGNGNVIHYPKMEVLKSRMVGSVYYAAVKTTKENESTVWAAICLTSLDSKDYFNFSYKDMDETCGPYAYDCPESILKLLTETDSEYAKAWREKCWSRIKSKKEGKTLGTLPVGSVITYKNYNGKQITLTKHKPAYQFKRAFWWDGYYVYPSRRIPKEFEIIQVGE